MERVIRTPCGKCNGHGRIEAYIGIAGGVCFACKGVGYFEKTEKQVEAARKRKAAGAGAKAAEQALHAAKVERLNQEADARMEYYRNDPRMGRETRERYNRFPAVAFETSKYLAQIDADPEWAQSKPWILQNIGR